MELLAYPEAYINSTTTSKLNNTNKAILSPEILKNIKKKFLITKMVVYLNLHIIIQHLNVNLKHMFLVLNLVHLKIVVFYQIQYLIPY